MMHDSSGLQCSLYGWRPSCSFILVCVDIGQTILKEQKIVGLHVHVHGTRLIYMYMYMYMHVAIRPVDPYDNRLAVPLTKHVCQVNTIQYALQ